MSEFVFQILVSLLSVINSGEASTFSLFQIILALGISLVFGLRHEKALFSQEKKKKKRLAGKTMY